MQEALLDVGLGHRLEELARGQLQGVGVLASQVPEHLEARGLLVRTMRNNSHGRDEKERLEDGVGLLVEIFGVTKKSGALGRKHRADLSLREELEGGRGVSDSQEKEKHLLETRQAGERLVLALVGLGRPAHMGQFLQGGKNGRLMSFFF